MTAPPPKYDAFLSYSHAVDRKLAPALQHAVQRYATPWYRLRSVRLFRDQTGLGADSGLWSAIERALAAAGWFVLLASPEAARSPWVAREVRWWLERNGARRLLIVVTSGRIGWDERAGRFAPDSDAIPPVLHAAFPEEPRWLDLRGVRQVEQLDRRLPAFAECVVDLASTLRDIDRDVLAGEDVRLLRRSRMLASGGVAGLAVLAATATALAVVARRQARAAVAAQLRAEAAQRQVVARTMAFRADGLLESDPRTALRLGLAAVEVDPTPDNRGDLIRNLLGSPYLGHTEQQPASVGLALAADGATLATVSNLGPVALWRLDGRLPPRPLGGPLPGQELRAIAAAISPDGATLAVGGVAGFDRCLELWDITDPAVPRKLAGPAAGHPGGCSDLAFTPDGSRVVSVGQNDGSVIVWDVRDRSDPQRIGAPALLHRAGIFRIDASPDGRLLATASGDGTAALSALDDDGAVRPLAHPVGEPQRMMFAARFDPSGTMLATTGFDRKVRLFDIGVPTAPQARGLPVTGFTNAVVDLAFRTVPGARTEVACAGGDGRIGVVDVTDADQPFPIVGFGGHGAVVSRVVFGAGGRTLVSGGAEGAAIAWDLEYGDQGVRRTLAGPTGQVAWVGFAPDGRRVGAVAEDGAARTWDPARPERPDVVALDPDDLPSAAAFLDDVRMLVGTECGHVLTVAPVSGAVTELRGPHVGRVSAVAATSGLAATCSVDGSVVLWRTAPVEAVAELPCGPLHPVHAATFTADGRILVLGGEAVEDRLTLWDVTDPASPRRLPTPPPAHQSAIIAVAVAARRPLLATGSTDTTVVLWDITDPRRPQPFANPIRDLRAAVQAVALDPEGTTLVAGMADGTTALFDLTDPGQPRRLAARKQRLGGPRSVAFAPVGRQYAVGGQDSVVTVVDLAPVDAVRRDPVARARERAGGGLDRAQWETFAPGMPYLDVR